MLYYLTPYVLNRNYKPLGFQGSEHIRYEDYPVLTELKKLTPALASKISHNNNSELDRIYLYDDGCIPTKSKKYMKDYLARIELLSSLKLL